MKNNIQNKILLVEDEALIAMAEAQTLKKYGYNVIIASSGEKAIEIANQTPDIDLILMDINLGTGIDGTEAAVKILEKHDLPLIFLSSHIEQKVVEKTEGITSYGYIVKNTGDVVLNASIKMAFRLFEAKLNEKAKEEKLKKSEELFRKMTEMSSVVIYQTDVNGKCIYSNKLWQKHTGLTFEETLGDGWVKGIYSEDRDMVFSNWEKMVSSKGQWGLEYRVQNKEGQLTWVYGLANPLINEDGKISGYIGVNIDITELKKIENELKNIFYLSPDMICVCTPDGNFLKVSPSCERILGYTVDEMINLGWSKLVHPDDAKVTNEEVEKQLKGKSVMNFTNRFKSKQGPYITLEWQATSVIDGIVYATARDITARIQNEKNLKEAHQEKTNLLKELQHRAKNSFTMISSMINLTSRSNASNDIKLTLNELNSRIIAISKMYELLYTTDSVSKVQLDEYISLILSSIPSISENINIEKKLIPLTISVKTAIPLGIIITELITNSIKHAFPDIKKGTILFELKKTNSHAVVEIIDNGIGLPNKFDISAINSLGLKLMKSLTEQINGILKIENDNGTKCFIKIPINSQN